MKVGADNKKKTMLAIGLAVVALIMVVRMLLPEGSSGASSVPNAAPSHVAATATNSPRRTTRRGQPATKTTAAPLTTSLDPRLQLNTLQQTESIEYTGKGRNIFLAQAEDVQIPKPIAPAMAKKPEPAPPPIYTPPSPPPIDLKFFGFANTEGVKQVFLSRGDDVFIASEGDIINRRYKIIKINANNIEVLDVLSNNQQTIPLTSG